MEPIYEGKAKRLYTTDNPNVLRMEYKDDATAGNGAKKAQFENKGRMNKAITLVIYRMLESKGVKVMESTGADFNPDFHEAIATIPAPSDDLKGKVVDTTQKGYMLNDKVLRYAKVAVGE